MSQPGQIADDAGPIVSTPGAGSRFPARLRSVVGELSALLLAAFVFLCAWPFVPELASPANLSDLLLNMLLLLAVALGETVVLICGGIDLSVTSTIAACGVISAWVMSGAGDGDTATTLLRLGLAVLAALATGVLIGLVNGVSIAILKMPPFLVTLSTMTIVGGATLWATHSRNIANLPDAFTVIGWGRFVGVPYFVWIVGSLSVVIHVLLAHTILGHWFYAIGHSFKVAQISGVPVRGVTILAYVISGACAAVAALLYTAQLETGSPTVSPDLLLDVVGATVIGGTSLQGGKGRVTGTVFGVLLYAILSNALNLVGLEHYTIMIVKGGVILIAAVADRLRMT